MSRLPNNCDGQVPPSFLAVAAGYVGVALVVCIGWTALFALFGLVCGLVTGDWDVMSGDHRLRLGGWRTVRRWQHSHPGCCPSPGARWTRSQAE